MFDKTGTLTKGVFNVTDILPANGFSKEQVLEYAVQAESFSNHPIAKSILSAYGKEIDQSVISDYKEISGYGISAMAGKKKVYDLAIRNLWIQSMWSTQPVKKLVQRFM